MLGISRPRQGGVGSSISGQTWHNPGAIQWIRRSLWGVSPHTTADSSNRCRCLVPVWSFWRKDAPCLPPVGFGSVRELSGKTRWGRIWMETPPSPTRKEENRRIRHAESGIRFPDECRKPTRQVGLTERTRHAPQPAVRPCCSSEHSPPQSPHLPPLRPELDQSRKDRTHGDGPGSAGQGSGTARCP